MAVDPVDGCTFWYTTKYANDSRWATRVGSFRFDGCGGPTPQCGNDTIEGSEVCDGTDLGGQTCADFGCAGGGTLACNGTCDGFDLAGCLGCPVCDGDGVCEAGEDCNGCASDCISGPGYCCGDAVCEGAEDSFNCELDCGACVPEEPTETSCADGVDNDCDALVDGDDPDCGCVPTATKEKGPRCSDGLDNDCDGLIDGADPDC